MRDGYGENLAMYQAASMSTKAETVVEAWAAEIECYTFGTQFSRNDACDMACTSAQNSTGCGHYTQVGWRGTTQVGCGVAVCPGGDARFPREVWVCNYQNPGNFIGQPVF